MASKDKARKPAKKAPAKTKKQKRLDKKLKHDQKTDHVKIH